MLTILNGVTAPSAPPGGDLLQLQLHRFLSANALEFPQPIPGRIPDQSMPTAFFDRTNGLLFVRASPVYLRRIEEVLGRLNTSPPQITVSVNFVEGDVAAIAGLNLPWLALAGGGDVSKVERTARLTESEATTLIARAHSIAGIEFFTVPTVTTLSGRPAQVSATEQRTVVTGQSNSPTGPVFLSASLSLGPAVDLTPTYDFARPNVITISAAGRVIEFLGYQEGKVPKPLIRTNAVSGEARLWDGQTLVLQMPPITNSVRMIDRVPVLSDIPLAGRLFRHESSGNVVHQRLLLITPVLIDPAGSRVNDPKHLPFDPATPP